MDRTCYHTFIIADPRSAKEIAAVAIEGSWSLLTSEDPSQRHWAYCDGTGISTFKHKNLVPRDSAFIDRCTMCQEVIICAHTDEIARNVQSLIYGGILLAYPDLLRSASPPSPMATGAPAAQFLAEEPFCNYFSHYDHALLGCIVASKAWENRRLIYSLEKLKLSLSLDWFTPHSAAPRYGYLFSNRHPEYAYHVNAAYAIVTAFAAIEELGFDVRSSNKNPRFIGDSKDSWNPVVRQNLLDRLDADGIDHAEPFLWVYRGDATSVEDSLAPKLGTHAPYSDAQVVRDRELQLIDAIHYASWLRNFVAAHKFSELAEAISPYDVHNVQQLARRLILNFMNLWKQTPTPS